jgi:hypothetical protein
MYSPPRSARSKAITGTMPAPTPDARHRIYRAALAKSCNNSTCQISSRLGSESVRNSHRSSSEGTFRVDTPANIAFCPVSGSRQA